MAAGQNGGSGLCHVLPWETLLEGSVCAWGRIPALTSDDGERPEPRRLPHRAAGASGWGGSIDWAGTVVITSPGSDVPKPRGWWLWGASEHGEEASKHLQFG